MRSNDTWKKISEIIDVRDGTHDSPKYVSEGYPLITSKNIKDNKIDFENVSLISKTDLEKINQRSKVDIGDIIMPMIGTIGNPVIVNTDILFAIKNVALFKFHKCNVDNRYIYYLLKSPIVLNQLHTLKRGGTQEFVSLANIRNLKIPLPPLETQKKIAAVLDKAQELIDKRKEQLARMDEFVQSVFLEMFGDPVLNGKSWSRIKLKEIAKVKIGPFGSSLHVEDYVKSGIPLVNPSHIVKGEILVDKEMTISAKKASELAAYRMKSGDVVLGRRGEIGRCAVVKEREDGFLCGTGSMFIALTEVLSPVYLAYLLSSTTMRAVLENNAKGITMKNLNAGVVENMNINLPPVDLQNQFAAIVAKTEQQKSLMQQSLAEMENNMNSLMQRAFKGELW